MVLAIKIDKKNADSLRKFLLQTGLLNKQYIMKKTASHLFFPITKKTDIKKQFPSASFVNCTMKKKSPKNKGIKQTLSKVLSAKELEFLKRAHDIVGDIAILEIPPELKKREKLIAESFLKINPRIDTVLKKADFHTTKYRTQKMKYLAGEKKTKTLHRENGVDLFIDVENVYYSARSSTERKRVSTLVKPGESVLVMFSGAAPFVCTIAKNTKAKEVYGIELNPEGHFLGLENIRKNRLTNTRLILGDVKKVSPILHHINIGLKSHYALPNLKRRVKLGARFIELAVEGHEWEKEFRKIEAAVKFLDKQGIMVSLHTSLTYKGDLTDLSLDHLPEKIIGYFGLMYDFAKKHRNVVSIGLHSLGHEDFTKSSKAGIIRNIRTLKKRFPGIYEYIYVENCIGSPFFSALEDMDEVLQKSGLKKLLFDLPHFYLTDHSYGKMKKAITELKEKYDVYFHIADSQPTYPKTYDNCPIGEGKIKLERLANLIDYGVIELWNYKDIISKTNESGYHKFIAMRPKMQFDRILMPLPMSANEFLDSALKVSKRGAVIHFYDFQSEDTFHKAHEKIAKACKKNKKRFKILNTVKCGQFSPKTFRICVDFRMY